MKQAGKDGFIDAFELEGILNAAFKSGKQPPDILLAPLQPHPHSHLPAN